MTTQGGRQGLAGSSLNYRGSGRTSNSTAVFAPSSSLCAHPFPLLLHVVGNQHYHGMANTLLLFACLVVRDSVMENRSLDWGGR